MNLGGYMGSNYLYTGNRGLNTIITGVILAIVIAIGVGALYFSMSEAQANFKVNSITLSDSKVTENQAVSVEVEVANTGGAKGSYEVELTLNGESYDSETVEVKSKKTEVVEF
ncbi:hypothetical protein AKJ41_05055 [candidate division MSBL1 archaeon SCGC-AAA259O05]|uniref:CARDB domain-containing protein n=1 Tax=candidate division MSBL1 archaeon SCGC-AAA259O05 TaxID=1698271 RepID=A0A133UZQ4_9EURY|nr:hypothetical protein AKJ41_05055 [candidate division MSBL1 archaeon SCGC-AAA259O05]